MWELFASPHASHFEREVPVVKFEVVTTETSSGNCHRAGSAGVVLRRGCIAYNLLPDLTVAEGDGESPCRILAEIRDLGSQPIRSRQSFPMRQLFPSQFWRRDRSGWRFGARPRRLWRRARVWGCNGRALRCNAKRATGQPVIAGEPLHRPGKAQAMRQFRLQIADLRPARGGECRYQRGHQNQDSCLAHAIPS